MKKLALLLTLAAIPVLVTACKSPEEKICDHLKTFVDDGKYSDEECNNCLLYTSPSPRDRTRSRMPSSA